MKFIVSLAIAAAIITGTALPALANNDPLVPANECSLNDVAVGQPGLGGLADNAEADLPFDGVGDQEGVDEVVGMVHGKDHGAFGEVALAADLDPAKEAVDPEAGESPEQRVSNPDLLSQVTASLSLKIED